MKVYNTLTRRKEEFKPLKPGQVTMYVCGPTVYNYIHIGNARSVIAFDVIRRYLEYKGYQVNYVSNFTDVDDKMINEARAEGTTVPKLATKFIQAYLEDTKALNVEPASLHPRATHEIKAIIKFIQVLIAKGYAYVKNGCVFYRAKKFAHYGQLSGQNIDQLEEGASKHISAADQAEKEDPIDFALWKAQKQPDEIAWDSPWGKGRPGWHIECSVMSTKYLGKTIDIHGGGEDLEFPHHENEIAQSEAETGQKFVNYWLHNGFVTVGPQAEKMSKSLHNFVTVRQALRTIDPQVLRFFMASVQYRRQLNFSQDNLQQAKTALDRFKNVLQTASFRLQDQTASQADPDLVETLQTAKGDFEAAMDDDFNVQNALTVLYRLVSTMNEHLQQKRIDKDTVKKFVQQLQSWLSIFGIEFKQAGQGNDAEIAALVKKRDAARAQKNWAVSDQIRDQLQAMGIKLQDTPQGTRWTRLDH